MSGEQFSERDRAFIDDVIRDVNVPYGTKVYIKRYTGISNPGDPARGVQPTLQFNLIPVRAIIESIAQQDVLFSGGVYQIGDIRVTLTQQLNYMDDTVQTGGTSLGDHLIYKEHVYRIVGRSFPDTLISRDKVYQYVFRKVGNA